MAYHWGLITSGATFHELVGNLLLHEDPATHVFNREGADGAIDALSGDRTTVYQSKHHKNGTPSNAIADARGELKKIQNYRTPRHKWQPIWSAVTTWKLITNVPFGPADNQKWQNDIVPEFAKLGLTAQYVALPGIEKMLADHPAVADAFFGQRPRLFVSLAEHRDALLDKEVLDRAWRIPLHGREDDLNALCDFVRNGDEQVLLVHGPGGVGKSRILVEAATQLVADGSVSTVYCGTLHLATSDNWYVGIVPETKALVVLDEPTDAAFVERVLTELRTRTSQWKVLVGVRTPRDPVIRALTDPREKLLASPRELRALEPDHALKYALELLAPLGYSDEEKTRAARWLREVCGNVPIWMTVAITLLERNRDLRELPKDEFEIAQKYIQDVLDHTRPEIGTAPETLLLLRWVALSQPVNRHSDAEIVALAAAIDSEPGTVQLAIEDLVRRRAVAAFGIDRRMLEVRPDVMRDHLLVSWLTVGDGVARRASIDAGGLANDLARMGAGSRLAEKVIRTLGRVENVARPSVRLLDPVAEAAVGLAESASNTAEQKQAIDFAATMAMSRPGHMARVAKAVRTRDVPETADDTAFGRFVQDRVKTVGSLPWQLFIAAHRASESDERHALLTEMVELVDMQATLGTNSRRYSDGKSAAELLPRMVTERRGYRSSFHGEAAALATTMLDDFARGGGAVRPSAKVLLQSLLSIGRHESYTDADDPDTFHFANYAVAPAGTLGKIAVAIRARLWELVERAGAWSEARELAWKLLDHFHAELNRHHDEAEWNALLLDDLGRARDVAASDGAALEDLQSARRLWRWHVQYERTTETKQLAQSCEDAYMANSFVAKFAAIFGDDTGDTMFETARSLQADDLAELEAFMNDASRFVRSHGDEWRSHRIVPFAIHLGEQRGRTMTACREFIQKHLAAGPGGGQYQNALAMSTGYVTACRAAGDPDVVAVVLDDLATAIGPERMPALIVALFVEPNRVSARRLGTVDYEFLIRHRSAFQALPIHVRMLVLGRMSGLRREAIDRALEDISDLEIDQQSEQLWNLWRGFFDVLPHPLTPDAIPSIVSRLFDELALRAGAHGPQEGDMWQAREVMKHFSREPMSYLVELVHRRLAMFGESNRRANQPGRRLIHILPNEDSLVLERVDLIADDVPEPSSRRAVEDLLVLEREDITIAHDLPEFLVAVDPHGRIVPDLIARRLADPLSTPTVEAVTDAARFAGWYAVGSEAWRTIASAACARLREFSGDTNADGWVYSRLSSQRGQSWSGAAGELHPRWQAAVDSAREALETEKDPGLRGFWAWCIADAERDLELARGRLEERDR